MLPAMLRIIARLRKITVRVLEHFILVPVAQLASQIRFAVRRRHGRFLFDRTLVQITVWVFLFWPRV
jgi:hypothetical protein